MAKCDFCGGYVWASARGVEVCLNGCKIPEGHKTALFRKDTQLLRRLTLNTEEWAALVDLLEARLAFLRALRDSELKN